MEHTGPDNLSTFFDVMACESSPRSSSTTRRLRSFFVGTPRPSSAKKAAPYRLRDSNASEATLDSACSFDTIANDRFGIARPPVRSRPKPSPLRLKSSPSSSDTASSSGSDSNESPPRISMASRARSIDIRKRPSLEGVEVPLAPRSRSYRDEQDGSPTSVFHVCSMPTSSTESSEERRRTVIFNMGTCGQWGSPKRVLGTSLDGVNATPTPTAEHCSAAAIAVPPPIRKTQDMKANPNNSRRSRRISAM